MVRVNTQPNNINNSANFFLYHISNPFNHILIEYLHWTGFWFLSFVFFSVFFLLQFTNIGLCTHFKTAVAYSEWIGSLDIQNRAVGTREGKISFHDFGNLAIWSDYTQHIIYSYPPPGFSDIPTAQQIVRIFLGKAGLGGLQKIANIWTEKNSTSAH